jgi:hypothetical protein
VNCHHTYRNYREFEEEYEDMESVVEEDVINSSDVDFVVSDDQVEYGSGSPEHEPMYISDEASEDYGMRRSRRNFRSHTDYLALDESDHLEDLHSDVDNEAMFSGVDEDIYSGDDDVRSNASPSSLQRLPRRPVILSDDDDE